MRHFGARGRKIIAWPLTIQRGGFAKITNESLTGIGVKVAWRISTDPSNSTNLPPIASSFLSAYSPVAAPTFGTASLSAGTLTIPWTGYQGILEESTDLHIWTAVPGNPQPLVVGVGSAPKKF